MSSTYHQATRCDETCDAANVSRGGGAKMGFSCEITPMYNECKNIEIDPKHPSLLNYTRTSNDNKSVTPQSLLCSDGAWQYRQDLPATGYTADGVHGTYACLPAGATMQYEHATGFNGSGTNNNNTPPSSSPASSSPSPTPHANTKNWWDNVTSFISKNYVLFLCISIGIVLAIVVGLGYWKIRKSRQKAQPSEIQFV